MTENNSRVFVTQETDHDFRSAEEFGRITFLTNGDLRNIKGSMHNESIVEQICFKLQNFNEEKDWIVIAGSPYVSALVFAILGKWGFRDIKVLRWESRDLAYRPMWLELRGANRG